MLYYVYVLHSLSYGTFYVGSTDNIGKRLAAHNEGLSKYTSGRRPWQLVYKEEFATRSEAMRREKFLKSGQGREQLKQILASKNMER